jgi:hypothetical protein
VAADEGENDEGGCEVESGGDDKGEEDALGVLGLLMLLTLFNMHSP